MLYILSGKPTPWARPGQNKGLRYDTQAKLKEAHSFEIMAQRPQPLIVFTKVPTQIVATFFFQMPKAWSEKKKKIMVGQAHMNIPDTDNLVKYINDLCQGLLFLNDSVVSSILAKKVWAWENRTEFQYVEIL